MNNFRPGLPKGSETWTVAEWAEWLIGTGIITTVRSDDEPTCARCHRPMRPDLNDQLWPRCYACNRTYNGLIRTVVPISYAGSGGLTSLIAQAKDEPERYWIRVGLASLLYVFMEEHQGCLEAWAGGPFDYATIVPSHPSRRAGRDHLKDLIGSVSGDWPGYPWKLDLLTKTAPSNADDRRQVVHEGLFAVNPRVDLAGQRVLLFDDLYTSGSTSASAAHALVAAGAMPPVVVTIGRQVDVGSAEGRRFVDELNLNDRSFELDECAAHARPPLFEAYGPRPHPWAE